MPEPRLCSAGRVIGPVVLASWLGLIGASVQAQPPATELEFSPSRLIAAQDLLAYVDFEGLDRHDESWRKTAAYRILNDTSTGPMLEDLVRQLHPKQFASILTPAEMVLLLKHVAKAGFVHGANPSIGPDGKKAGAYVFVFRKAFSNKDVRPIFARLLQSLPMVGTKPQTVVKSGHKAVTGMLDRDGTYAWWIEESKKEDLILIGGPPGALESVLEVLDGKKPSILSDPSLAKLADEKPGFDRTGFAIVNLPDASAGLPVDLKNQLKLQRVDFQNGFQGDSLTTLTRLHPLQQARAETEVNTGFDRQSIPNIPTGVLGMMVFGFNPKSIIEEMDRDPASRAHQFHESLRTFVKDKTKLRFDEDILNRLGPKITAYVMPTKTGSAASPALLNMIGSMVKASVSGSVDAIPKAAVLIDVNDSAGLGKSLDEVMIAVNRILKNYYAQQGEPRGEAPSPGGRGRMRGAPGPGGPPGLGGPSPEFRVMTGETKSYVFTVPPEMSARFPANFRPTIRLGPKQLAVALSADVARQALEAKGAYTAPAEIKAAFDQLPSKLNWLMIVDPRDSVPEVLASLPGKLQAGINIFKTPAVPTDPVAAPAASPSPEGQRSRPGKFAMTMGGPAPTPPPDPQANATPTTATSGSIIFQVDPGKLPAADAIRRLLFPAIYTLDQDGDVIRFSTREAFPPVPDPAMIGLLAKLIRSQQPQATPKSREVTDGFFDVPKADSPPKPEAPAGVGSGPTRVKD